MPDDFLVGLDHLAHGHPAEPPAVGPPIAPFLQELDKLGQGGTPPRLENAGAEGAFMAQNTTQSVGIPTRRDPVRLQAEVKLGNRAIPTTAQQAIEMWGDAEVRIPNTPAYAKKVDAWASAKAFDLLRQEGLITPKGRFAETLSDELMAKVKGGLLYVGAHLLSDLTEPDVLGATRDAMLGYLADIEQRVQARSNEIIANFSTGPDPRQATRDTLNPEGQRLLAEQDAIGAAVVQLRAAQDKDATVGGFKSLVGAAQAYMMQRSGGPGGRAVVNEEAQLLESTRPMAQDLARFILVSMDENDAVTGPGRLFARTFKVLQNLNNPKQQYDVVRRYFTNSVNRVRMQRMGAPADADPSIGLYMQFPEVAAAIADAKLTSAMLTQLGQESFKPMSTFERELDLARRTQIPGIVQDMAERTLTARNELQLIEARAANGALLADVVDQTKNLIRSVFETTGDAFGPPAQSVLNLLSRPGADTRRLMGQLADARAVEEVRALPPELTETQRLEAVIKARQQAVQRAVARASMPEAMREAAQRAEEAVREGKQSAPLDDENATLRDHLIQAEREGSMPWDLRKVIFSEDPTNLVSNAAIWFSDVMAPNTVRRMLEAGLGPEEVRRMFLLAQESAFKEQVLAPHSAALKGGQVSTRTIDELDEVSKALTDSLSRLSPLERATTGIGKTIALAQVDWERGWKNMLLGFTQNPSTVFNTVVGALPIGALAGAAGAPVLGRAKTVLARSGLARRLTNAVAATARFDPESVASMRRVIGDTLDRIGAGPGDPTRKQLQTQRLMEAATNTLRTMEAEHANGTVGAMARGAAPDARVLDQSARHLQRTLAQLGLGEIENLTESLGLPLQALAQHHARSSVTSRLIQESAAKLRTVLRLDRFEVPSWVAANSPKTINTMLAAVEAGAGPDWDAMPFSPDAAAQRPDVYQRMGALIDRLKPGSKRIIDATGQYTHQVLSWVTNFHRDALAVRHLQAAQRGTQVSFLRMMIERYGGQLEEGRLTGAPDPALVGKLQRAQSALESLDQRQWDTPLTLANTEFAQDAPIEDLVMWARHNATPTEHEFWRQMRNVGESREDFDRRVGSLLDSTATPQVAQGFRGALTRRYLNAPGLSSQQQFDTLSGMALTPREAARLRGERRAAGRARDTVERVEREIDRLPDNASAAQRRALQARLDAARGRARYGDEELPESVLDDLYGIREVDLKGPYADMVRFARTEDALSAARLMTRMQDMSDGRISSKFQEVRDIATSLGFNVRAQEVQNAWFARQYAKFTPEQRTLFDAALAHNLDWGDSSKLRQALDADPELRAALPFLETDENANVRRLLQDSNDFRKDVLRDAMTAGVLTRTEFDTYAGAYSPHLYSANEHRKLMGEQFPETVFAGPADSGIDASEFIRQKHFEKFKVQVYVRGGAPLTRLFDTAEEAQEFLRSNYGVKRTTQLRDGSVEGTTQLDDPYAILPPVTEQRARDLGFLGEGPSLFARLDTLVKDTAQAHLLKTLDRPGWVLSDTEYRARLANPDERARVVSQFGDAPLPDTPSNGPLRGRFVHYKVRGLLNSFQGTYDRIKNVGELMREFAQESGIRQRLWLGTRVAFQGALEKTKQAIVSNFITRRVQTTAYNFLMDSELFGTLAAGRDFSLLHPRALKHKSQAAADLFGTMRGDAPRPEFLEAIRLGVIDDSLISHRLDPGLRNTLVEILYGDVSRAKHLSQEMRTFVMSSSPGAQTWQDALSQFLGRVDDPQLRTMFDRWHAIEESLQSGRIPVDSEDFIKLSDEQAGLEARLEKAAPTTRNNVRRGWQALYHATIGDKATGKFAEFEPISREIYSRVGNINRLGAYYHLRAKGVGAEEAVARLNLFMQHYSAVPHALKRFGNSFLGSPVVAFPYEMLRIGVNALKFQPEALMAASGAIAATNFMTMVAAGLNPYSVMDRLANDSAGFPAALAFATSLLWAENDGTFSTIQVPALNVWQIMREPFGVQAKMMGLDDTPEFTFGQAARNIATKVTLGQPLTHLAYAFVQGRDPETGQILRDRSSFWGKAAREMFGMFVPAETPFIGNVARDIARGLERPRHIRSGKQASAAQIIIQQTMGVRLRGRLGSGPVAAAVAGPISTALGVPLLTKVPVKNELKRAFGAPEVLNALFVQSREVDPQNAAQERILDESFDELRRAAQLLESSDAGDRKAGKELRDQAVARWRAELAPLMGMERARTEQELFQMFENVGNTQRFEAHFDRASLARKAYMIVGGIYTGLPRATVDDLIQRTMLTTQGELRLSSSLRSINDAKMQVDRYIADPYMGLTTPRLLDFQKFLAYTQAYAEAEFAEKRAQAEINNAASNILFEK